MSDNKQTGKKGGKPNRYNKKTSNGSNNAQKAAPKKKKTLEDYTFYVGSSKQASDYEITSEYIINHIKMTFERGNDIAESLRNLTLVDTDTWKPTLRKSTSGDTAVAELENEQYKMEFTGEHDEYIQRRRVYQDNQPKAYSLLWERCAKAMQNKVNARADFADKIYNKPIAMLKAIKEHSLNYQETRYEMSIISDAFRAVFNTKQKEGENLQDYTRRFKTARDILESHVGGPIKLPKFVGNMQRFKLLGQTAEEECYNIASEQFLAFVYLENADQDKYGSIMANLNQQKSLSNDQYPRTITQANNVLSNHPFDNFKKNKNNQNSNNNNNNHNNQKKTKHENGEDRSDDNSPVLSFAQMEDKCYCCSKPGHKSPDCRLKDKKPKEEWAINKAQLAHLKETEVKVSNTQQTANGTPAGSTADSREHVGWAGTHCSFFQKMNLKELILLDSDSTETVFCNPRYVTNIRATDEILELGTNGGPMISNIRCDVPHLGTHWYNEKSITNIISLAHMAEKYKVTYDSGKEKAFLVHMPHRIVKFRQFSNGLYGMNPNDPTSYVEKKKGTILINTMEENATFLSPRQLARAQRARKLYYALGTPSIDDLKAMIRMNMIRNNEVTTDDVNLAMKVYGPDVAGIKGRTTRNRPLPVINNTIEIPDELLEVQKDVVLSIDGMTVNSLKFLTTISHDIQYRTAQYLSNTTADVFKTCMREVIGIYRKGGFSVREIHCDNEFRSAMDALCLEYEPPIIVNYATANEHVPRAERNNRTIKERIRTTYHRLPYNKLPRILVKYMTLEATKKLNYFPNKNGVSKYFSPRMILHRENLDFQQHCQYTFGEYVQAHDEPTPSNTNAARSLDCIYLRAVANRQGGHELLHLQTNRVITRRKCTTIPVTPSVIQHVHALADADNMPNGLKIVNRQATTLFDSAWTAGVDYNTVDTEDINEEAIAQNENEEITQDDTSEERDYLDENELADILENNQAARLPQENFDNDNNMDAQDDETHIEDDIEEDNDDGNENPFDQEDEDSSYQDSEDQDESLDIDTSEDEKENNTSPQLRRSQRMRIPNPRYQHVHVDKNNEVHEYTSTSKHIIATIMCLISDITEDMTEIEAYSFAQTYSLNAGLKKFGARGKEAAHKEMKQLHDRKVWKPIKVSELTEIEKKRAMESLIFLTEKRDGLIKGRTCANGSTQRPYTPKEEAASPTAATEAILITGVIDAKQKRDVMTLDVPNAFVQTEIPKRSERIIMKIRGPLVDILVNINPTMYKDFVVQEGKSKVLYVDMMKALYGMMIASILYYKKFRQDIEKIGFVINPYDICVANRMIKGKQQTITWHVDDVKSSHVDPTVNDEFYQWCEKMYGSEETGHVKCVRGKKHDYLAMILDFNDEGKLKVDMRYYVRDMLEKFPYKIEDTNKNPWSDKLFKVDENTKALSEEKKAIFHTFVMKAMFLCKRGRPDIGLAICFLSSRVTKPNESDWNKLLRVMGFLKATEDEVLTLEADDSQNLYWFIDAAFAVHSDMRSHTGAMLSLGKGAVLSDSTKQKANARSSTEAELNGIDDKISKVLWVKKFVEAQGFVVKLNVIYQDNTSTIKLSKNGKASSGKRTRHFDIKLFYVTDLIDKEEVQVEYCPTEDMVADFMTKPLTGKDFYRFRDLIMNLTGKPLPVVQQECVGK